LEITLDVEPEDEVADSRPIRPHRELERRAIKGTAYVVIFYGVSLVLRVASSIFLSRLFSPEYFGIMTLLTTVLVGLSLFSHIGLADSIIQNPRGEEPGFLNTAWTLQVLRGIGLWILTGVLAWPVARFYHEPRMAMLFPALGVGCVLAGLSSPSLLVLARHLGVGKTSALEFLGQVVQFAVTIAWALVRPSLWALVGGRIASELVRTAVSYLILPDLRPRFTWEKESVRELFHFGRWILIGTILTFLAQQSDRLILGKLVPVVTLGVYGIAYALSDLPRMVIGLFCSRVGFPFIARFAGRPRDEYRAILLKYRWPVLAVGGLGLVLVICTGDQVILHVYDHRYREAAWMIGILAVGLWHTVLYNTVSPAILALSKAHYNAASNLVYCISLFTLIPVGFHYYGLPGAVIAVAVGDLPVYFVVQYAAHRESIGTVMQDIAATAAFAVVLAGALTLRHALGFGLPFSGFHLAL
jgi:O-antigen/teichoic acid export membrane protein